MTDTSVPDAVDLAIAEKLEGLAAAMRRGDIADVYIVWADWEGHAVIVHTGDDAASLVRQSLDVPVEHVPVGRVN